MQKFWKKNKKHLPTGKKGLTLLEVIIAVAVLTITILASTAVSSTYLKSRMSIKKYQANNEELSMALNSMSKDIRMSNTLTPGIGARTSIVVKSNVDDSDITYAFVAGNELRRTDSSGTTIIAENVTGGFFVVGDPAITIPRITVRIKKESTGMPAMTAQTTVSMRSGYVPVP